MHVCMSGWMDGWVDGRMYVVCMYGTIYIYFIMFTLIVMLIIILI